MGFKYPKDFTEETLSMLITSADTPGPDVLSLVGQSGLGPVYIKRQRQHCGNSAMTLIRQSGLGPVYTKRQRLRQRYDSSAMALVILFSLKRMELLENGLQPDSGETPK